MLGISRRKTFRGNPDAVSDGSLTAAGYRIERANADNTRRLAQPWQARSFAFYDQLGEIKYAAQFYARMLAPLKLYAAKLDSDGDWVETTDEEPVAALERIQDPGGGREGLLGAYGRLMFIAGEGILFCSLDKETELEQWEMLSSDELKINGPTYMRYKAPTLEAEEFREADDDDYEPVDDDHAVAYRLWKRHPRYSMLADSTMQGVLELCDELLIMNRAVRARARSRLASAGILAISEDFSYSPLEAVPDEDSNEDPFLVDLTAAMMAAIANEGSASAAVPLVVRGTTEAIDKGIKHIQIVDPTQLYPETGLRYELIKRIATGLDMPPEILLGLADSNHWTAWQIDEQTWKGHGMPIADQLVNDLNSSFFRPQLRKDGVSNWQKYAIRYDPSAIINHPDRTKDAKDLFDRVVIGQRALREASGFDEDDAPTEEERAQQIGILTRDASLAWYGIPSLKSGGIEPEAGEIQQGDGGSVTDGNGAALEPGPPKDDQPPDETVVGAANPTELARALALARTLGALDVALLRAREVAGNRLKSLAKRNPDALRLIEGVPVRDIPATLGFELARNLGAEDARSLVAPATDLLIDSLRVWLHDEKVSALVADQIERHAARTLYELRPSPLTPQLQAYLDGVMPSP